MPISFNIRRDDARRVARGLVEPKVRAVTNDVYGGAKRTVNVKTGKTRASVYRRFRVTATKVRGTVGARSPYVMIEHDGARRHIISRRPGGPLLRFYWPKVGGVVTFAKVNHPGRKGSGFLRIPLVKAAYRRGFAVRLNV